MSRLQQSSSETLRERVQTWGASPLRELGMAIATKVEILAQSMKRFRTQLARLTAELKGDLPQLEECLSRGSVFQFKDTLLSFELLVDIDSFIFETRSLYEIVGKFLPMLFKIFFGRAVGENELLEALSTKGIDTRWIYGLRKNRILFFHETAPWIGARISQLEPLDYELLILKRHTVGFENPDDYIGFNELRAIYDGIVESLVALHRVVMGEIADVEAQGS
jgi:hypothetical protein